MKEYLLLHKTSLNNYLIFNKTLGNNSLSQLFFILFSDFRPKEKDFLNQMVSFYNASFIYHNFKYNMLYLGRADWELDEDITCPSDEEFSDYVNENNSCKMSLENFLEFRKQWIALKQNLQPFAIIYRDEHDWVDCKGFDSKEAMELFVKNYQPAVEH